MAIIKVIFLMASLQISSCVENVDHEKCKDRFGASLGDNFALFKPATQTSTKGAAVASRAVDGNTNPYFGNLSCSETDAGNSLVWKVDLGQDIYLTSVTITTRIENQYRVNPNLLHVYSAGPEWKCAEEFFPSTGESITVTCVMPMKSNAVEIKLFQTEGILSLCEVEVHGWKFNHYENEVNFALWQTGRLSSVHSNSPAELALDGNHDTNFNSGSCMHTGSVSPFWSVDLGNIITVTAVTITSVNVPNDIGRARISDFVIRVGMADEGQDENYESCVGRILGFGSPETRTFFCTNPIRGRYVTIVSRLAKFFHLCEVAVHGYELECASPQPLGMETFKIHDSQLTASSVKGSNNIHGPQNARLSFNHSNSPQRFPCWIAGDTDTEPWIEVNLLWLSTVSSVLTQGRHDLDQWVTSFSVSIKVDGNNFQFYMENNKKKIFIANSDRNSIVRQIFHPYLLARWIRINPVTWFGSCSMRMELIGCQNELQGSRPPQSLGMTNGKILDGQLSSSSNDDGWEPKNARLNLNVNGWAATTPENSWLQVEFFAKCVIFEIQTQGSVGQAFWIKTYQIFYASNVQFFFPYQENGVQKTFAGNTDQHSIVTQILLPVIVAKVIRIHPISWEQKTGLRVEFIGYYRENSIPRALGMQNRFIKDWQLDFSSIQDKSTNKEIFSRSPWLKALKSAWTPASQIDQWLQINFLRSTKVTNIKTQGRMESEQFVATYQLSFGDDGSFFKYYYRNGEIRVFRGNWEAETQTINSQMISPAIVSQFIRIHPKEFNDRISLRIEFEGSYIGFRDSCQTSGKLGMEDRIISVHQISASSYFNDSTVPDRGRLNMKNENGSFGAWVSAINDANQWYQVDFERIIRLVEIDTQGKTAFGSQEYWVKEYTVSYGYHPERIDAKFYQQSGQTKVFQANNEPDSIVRNALLPAIVARIIRLHIHSWNTRIAMRLEFVGAYQDPHGPALIDPDYVALEKRLTASSFLDHRHQPIHGIISDKINATSWTPLEDKTGEYIQVDLLQLTPISGVGLRTGGDHPNDSYVEVMLQYRDAEESWSTLKDYRGEIKILSTSDCDTEFEKLVVARFVRLVITGWGSRTGFVFQLYGTKEYHRASAGIESGLIKDNQMKSSNHPNDPYPAYEARLNYGGAWCGNTQRRYLYLQVDFLSNFEVNAVATQPKSSGITESVTRYKLSSTFDDKNWTFYQEDSRDKIFEGNTSCLCTRKHLVRPFLVRSVRFHPTSWQSNPCMRVDVYGIYKGILQIHVRSGRLLDDYGLELTNSSSIKLNGKDVSKSNDGINVVIANYKTGDLVSSNSVPDYSTLNNLLKSLENDSIVVLATQNLHERPPEDTLQLLQSLGGIKLRYSLTSAHDPWILVGYKGQQREDWITVKVGERGKTAIRVSASVHLNQVPNSPEFHEYFTSTEDSEANSTELSIAGGYSRFVHNISTRCEPDNNPNCKPSLSLAMWMKPDQISSINNEHTFRPIQSEERIVLKYYSNGYRYIIPVGNLFTGLYLNWDESRKFCLTLGADLPVILDKQTENAINSMLSRTGVKKYIHIGLRRDPITSEFKWVDGSPVEYNNWHGAEPSSETCSCRFENGHWNALSCTDIRPTVCQQSTEDYIGLVPLGLERKAIPDDRMTSSTFLDVLHTSKEGRINSIPASWCAPHSDAEPYLQVDLGDIKTVCGVGTQGRDYVGHQSWPKSYYIKLSNDSSTWIYFSRGGRKKVFQANYDISSVVINRFHEPVKTQLIRLVVLEWPSHLVLCMKMELFSCSSKGRDDERPAPDVPKSITVAEPEHCLDVLMSGKTTDGVYMINPGNGAFPVYCDQTTDGGGWTVFQRRMDGTVDFYRNHEEYVAGFGDLSGEYWLGLSKIALLTHSYSSNLRIDLDNWWSQSIHVVYSDFTIDEARSSYKLHYSDWLGPDTDSLFLHKDATFSAKDFGTLNDTAVKFHAGWWFKTPKFRYTCLNGRYYDSETVNEDGIIWQSWRLETLKQSKMMLRWNGKGGKQGPLELADWHTYISSEIEVLDAKLNGQTHFTIDQVTAKYIQADIFTQRRLTHILTQGMNSDFVNKYYLQLSTGVDYWTDYRENDVVKIFEGNKDATSVSTNCLKETELTRMVRLYPVECKGSCSLRIEIYSCFETCSKAVGIQYGNGKFPDINMDATSTTYNGHAKQGRLDLSQSSHIKSWRAERMEPGQYLEVRLSELYKITSVATQGGSDCWVKSFSISYRNKDLKWKQYTGKNGRILPGNRNVKSVLRTHFDRPFLAYVVRFVVKTWHNKICMRTEVYGCPADNAIFVVHTREAIAGQNLVMKGKYRYCEHCECPGCLKSLWLRVFGEVHLAAASILYDCEYHEFEIPINSSIVPGSHKIHMGASESSSFSPDEKLLDERMVGTITVTEYYPSCLDLLFSGQTKNGVYKIQPNSETAFEVYCDQETFGGGWTVFQRRLNSAENFDRVWADYKTGFGNLTSEFWLGNDYIHELTIRRKELLLDLNSVPGDSAFILYKSFQVENEATFYKLHVSEYQQSVGDCFSYNNGMKFTTNDQDQDVWNDGNCAVHAKAGWWHKACTSCHFNGRISDSAVAHERCRMNNWQEELTFLKKSEMKLRDRNIVTCNDQYCYYLLKSSFHWSAAQEKCRSFKADLLSVRDDTENQWIVNNILKNQTVNRVHLGIQNLTHWIDDSGLLYNNFQGSNSGDDCPYLEVNGGWSVGDCGNLLPTLCKRAKFCHKEACHVFTTQTMDHNAAKEFCRERGYDIPKINSPEKNEYILNVIRSLTITSSWMKPYVNVKRSGPEHLWFDGSSLTYENWGNGEPNDEKNECAFMNKGGTWWDAHCSAAIIAPVCERVLNSAKNPKNCLDLLLSGSVRSGVYTIDPDGEGSLSVYCDQENFGGGWTMLMRQAIPKYSFYYDWEVYKKGFGSLEGDFWLGNENIHRLTRVTKEMLFHMKSQAGGIKNVHYKSFKVADESDFYRLNVGEYQTSPVGDAMADLDNMRFSTYDVDNDFTVANCAWHHKGGWWYNNCGEVMITTRSGTASFEWQTWASNTVIDDLNMKIRSQFVVSCTDYFCYYRMTEKKSWSEAVKMCRKFNADLVSIRDEAEQQWVIDNILVPRSLNEIYIGLGMENTQTWTDGSSVSFTKLVNVVTADKCVILKKDGSWEIVDCVQPQYVLCKRGKFCIQGDCYVVDVKKTRSYTEGENFCHSLGFSLAKITNDIESDYAGNLVRETTSDSSFTYSLIGLKQDGDRHRWLDNTLCQYSDWASDEPSSAGQTVTAVHLNSGQYEWEDWGGGYDVYFTICDKGPIVDSCTDVLRHGNRENGFYSVSAGRTKQFTVYCDLISPGNPWTVIQRRLYESEPTDFHSKSWTDYKNGFSSHEMNFWLGNEYIHQLAKTPQRLKIVIQTEFNLYEAVYENFTVGDEASGYQINFGAYSGTAGDSFSKHRGMRFSTIDNDTSSTLCTALHPGGWWFADCLDSNLNGLFTKASNRNDTIYWKTIKESIIRTEMKIQPQNEKASNLQWFTGAIHLSNASLGVLFTPEETAIKVRTSSEEWTTRVPSPGPFLSHVAITWEENGHLRYYENGSLLKETASVQLLPADQGEPSFTVYRQYIWLNELKLWNSVLSEEIARIQHSTRNFTFDEGVHLWTFANASEPYSWNTSNSCSPTEMTGPCGDHTYLTSLGTFVFTEASRPAESNDRALVISPNLPGSNYRCLKFWFHMMGEKFGSLNIHVSRENNFTSTWNIPVLHLVEDRGNRWQFAKVDLDIANVFKIIFEAVRGDGSKADVAVDDVMLTAEGCQKECHPPCIIGERCDQLSLACIREGYYDHRWRLDSLDVKDDKDSKHGNISGDVQLQKGDIFGMCTALRGNGKIELRTFKRICYNPWCFPFQTLSFWLKYEEMNFQNIISFGKLINITQNGETPKEHLSVEVNTAYRSCSTSIRVPPEVWTHVIVSVNALEGEIFVYVDGIILSNNSHFLCVNHSNIQTYNEVSLIAGGGSNSYFSLDDVHLLFDVLEASQTVESYKNRTGLQQKIFVKAQLTEETWSEDLSDDESEKYQKLSQLIKTKFMETFQDRSRIKDVVVERFMQGSVIADINVIYDEVNYQDILLMEEALEQNNSLNGLKIKSLELNSSSVPNVRPKILAVILDPENVTTVYLNWTEVSSDNLNGVPQGYKILYRVTENTTEAKYTAEVSYGNSTETKLLDLEPLTNYTMRVLAFTLSGDGFVSDSVTFLTLDGAPQAPNMTVNNISSTSLYVNWTMLPNSTVIYKQLLGYQITYWKESEEDRIYNLTQFENYLLLENLEMWTTYCFNVTAFTYGNTAPTQTQCARTFEDAPHEPPRDFTVLNVNITAIEMSWLPPNESAVPGIIRYYNLSYRILNESGSEITSLTLERSKLRYALTGLSALSLVQINISAFTVSSGPKQSIMALTDEGVPLVAPNLTATNISSTSFKLQWTGIPEIFHNGILLGFHLYLWKQESGIESAENKTFKRHVRLVQFNGVAKWTVYCAKLTGFTAIGDGAQSSVECTRTFEDAPMATASNFIATDVKISTIDLSWSAPPTPLVPGILRRYNLTYRNLNYTNEVFTKESFGPSVTTHKMENLFGLTLYEINITAITILPGPWSTLYVLTLEGVPSIAPPNATWTNTSSTSIRVSWSAFPKHLINGILLGYRAFIWKESDGPASNFTVDVPSEAVSASSGNLQKYTTYCGEVEAFTKEGEGPKTPVGCIRTSEDAVETAPGPLNVSNITWNECHLSWEHVNLSFVPGILRSYRVTYRIIDPRFDQSNTTFFVDSQYNSTVVTGLIGFVDYEIMVNGFTVKDAPISISYFKTKEGVPTSPPTQFLSTAITETTIQIAWQKIPLPARHGIITGYKVTYKKSASRSKREDEKTLTFDADTYKAFLFKLNAYTNYTITVRGRTSIGYGVPTEIIVRTLQGTPVIAPKGFYGVNFTGPTSIFVSWGSLSTAELQGLLVSYEVKYQAFSVADEELLEPQPVKVIIVHDVSIKITGLSTYTTYKVSIRAISGGGKGVPSTVLYVATCRCHKTFTTNFWKLQPYVNISGHNKDRGFFPHLLDMVTLSCCQNCLEHGTTDINYFVDGKGRPSEKETDIDVKRNVTLATDYSFPVYGFFGQEIYAKYYGYSAIVEVVGSVFFALKPDSSVQGNALMASILSITPFLAITVIFAYIAGIFMWFLERRSNEDEFSPSFFRGAGSGFWWAYISMTTVGYGDKTARTLGGRIFAIIWVFMGLVISSLLIGSIASAFTASTSPPPEGPKMLYGAKIAALQDSPDHRLGVRRSAEVNILKKYRTLDELRKAVFSKQVDGLLVDSYVADSRRELFSDLSLKQVIDMKASYGVVMGADASKLRKCIKKYWVENAAMRSQYIKDHTNPIVVTEVSAADAMENTFTPEGEMYKLTLMICTILLCVGTVCGFIYETIRRKRKCTKVKPENVSVDMQNYCQQELSKFQEKLHKIIEDIKTKHFKQIIKLSKLKRKTYQRAQEYSVENTGDSGSLSTAS